MLNNLDYKVAEVDREVVKHFLLNKHYAQRVPSISYSFGLYFKDVCVGVCTVGKPASNALCIGVCGAKYSSNVYELNRVVIEDGLPKNAVSWFLSRCLKQLPQNLILVSYADDGVGHKGYIYQATNWIYTGCTKSRTDKYTPEGKHSRHYTNEHLHLRKVRTSKHRYVRFGKQVKHLQACLNYPIQDYPKGDNTPYVLGHRVKQMIINTLTNEHYYE